MTNTLIIELVRPAQAWRELGISPRHGWRLIKSGVLPNLHRIGDSTAPNAPKAFLRHELEAAKRRLIGLEE
jgi:hypothetical protein